MQDEKMTMAQAAAQGGAPEDVEVPTGEEEQDSQGRAEEFVGKATKGLKQEEATPEEQEMFSRIEMAVKDALYSNKKAFNGMANTLKQAADMPEQLIEIMAEQALTLFSAVDNKTEGGIPEIMIMKSLEVSVDYIVDMAEKVGIEVSEQMANQTMKAVVTKAGDAYGVEVEGIDAAFDNEGLPEDVRSGMKKAMGDGQGAM